MEQSLEGMVIPKHVALILDGNGRWAKKRGLPRPAGHKAGCVTVEKTVEIAARMGIRYLTVYGFSTENWKRSSEEVVEFFCALHCRENISRDIKEGFVGELSV